MKTNAARILDQLQIEYELRACEVSEDELDAISVARKVGMPPEATFKTLVARGDKTGVVMACVPADAELDLKKLAAATGNKKIDLVPVKELLALTGYIRGGVSPLGARKKYPVLIDETVILHDRISVSAGTRGLQMILAPEDLQRAADAVLVDLSKPSA
ncbi:MAG TPA: Cys-tRNA(Pro) deacylase [Blastocatellia bacterium]|nr:Cys-tRNA(Pro) deacylase [Blastocatellia bacterium]